jgi:large subunit ribosomal protein L1
MMVSLSKIAKILGSRGLMPNPKAGTITMEVGNVVKNIKTGTVEYRTDKGGIIHLGVGKVSFSAEKLSENIKVLISHISRSRPGGIKGIFIKKVTLSSTMGIGINIDLATLQQ